MSLLSGRDFETRENLETIAADSFKQLREGVEAFVNENKLQAVFDDCPFHWHYRLLFGTLLEGQRRTEKRNVPGSKRRK